MKIAFLTSDKAREQLLADAVLMGARRHGHTTEVIALQPEPVVGDYHIACMVGVKSRALYQLHQKEGVPVAYFDKGYCRQKREGGVGGWQYWRFSINQHHPTNRLATLRQPTDRLDDLGLDVRPWRVGGQHVLIAGSSAKYHEFYGLRDPTHYARNLIKALHGLTARPLVYRPKPSWRDAVPIKGAQFSTRGSIDDALTNAWALVTHGSNACFEAVVSGIPCVILGNAVALPLSSPSLEHVVKPRIASDAERRQWLANIAYYQWTMAELSSGSAWDFIGQELHA